MEETLNSSINKCFYKQRKRIYTKLIIRRVKFGRLEGDYFFISNDLNCCEKTKGTEMENLKVNRKQSL